MTRRRGSEVGQWYCSLRNWYKAFSSAQVVSEGERVGTTDLGLLLVLRGQRNLQDE